MVFLFKRSHCYIKLTMGQSRLEGTIFPQKRIKAKQIGSRTKPMKFLKSQPNEMTYVFSALIIINNNTRVWLAYVLLCSDRVGLHFKPSKN